MNGKTFSNPRYCLFVAQETGRLLQKEFKCKKCGQCCYEKQVIVLNSELSRLSKNMGLTEKEFRLKYLRKVKHGWSIRRTNPCLFFDGDTRLCTIYEYRPINCMIYPFLTQWFVYDLAFRLNGKAITPKNVLPLSCAAHDNMSERIKSARERIEKRIRSGELIVPKEYID